MEFFAIVFGKIDHWDRVFLAGFLTHEKISQRNPVPMADFLYII